MSWHGVSVPVDPIGDRAGWLEARRAGIGASDVAAILGLSPWSSQYEVWASKTKGYERESSESMDWGRWLEDLILDRWSAESDLHVNARQWLVTHPEHTWAMATIDGLAFEAATDDDLDNGSDFEPVANVQAKTDHTFGGWPDGVPRHIRIQTTWEMFVTGLTTTFVPTLHHGRQFEVYEVDYDEALAATIFEKVSEWRDKFIVGDAVPDIEAGALDVVKGVWDDPDPDGRKELDKATVADIEAWEGWKQARKDAEEQVKHYEAKVRAFMENATVGTVGGTTRITLNEQSRKEFVMPASTFRVLRSKT